MNDQDQTQRAPREWVELTTIVSTTSPIVVRVQTTASGRPLYSMEIGVMRDGRMLRHMPVFTQPDGLVTPFDLSGLTGMIRQAEEAVAVDASRKAADWQAQQNRREGAGRPPGRTDRGNGKHHDRRNRENDKTRWR
jgi:hypothetical protein